MPIKKAAKKALRQTRKRTIRNKEIKASYKKMIKKAKKEIKAKKKDEVVKTVSELASVIDKAAKRGVIHKNKAARIKSRLMRELNKSFEGKLKITKKDRQKQEPKKSKAGFKEVKKTASKPEAKKLEKK